MKKQDPNLMKFLKTMEEISTTLDQIRSELTDLNRKLDRGLEIDLPKK